VSYKISTIATAPLNLFSPPRAEKNHLRLDGEGQAARCESR